MTITEMHMGFKLKMDNVSSNISPDFLPTEIDFYINNAAEIWIKSKYGGLNTKRTSFEETQKRTDDLSDLVTNVTLKPLIGVSGASADAFLSTDKFTTTWFQLPDNYWFSVSELVELNLKNCTITTLAPVKKIRHTELGERLSDPFTRPEGSETLRVMSGVINTEATKIHINNSGFAQTVGQTVGQLVELYHDIKTKIISYKLKYIRAYKKLNYNITYGIGPAGNPRNPNNLPNADYTSYYFNHQTHQEILDIAVSLALEATANPRLMTHNSINVLNQE